jgi:integrase
MPGSIVKRGSNSYRLTFEVGRDERGHRIRRTHTVRGSYKEAQQRLTELVRQRDRGIDVAPNRLTLAEFLKQWLETHNVSEQSKARYRQLIRNHITPTLGGTRLTTLRPLHLQRLLSEAEARVSASTAHDVFTVLNMALNQAVKWELLARNPMLSLERPRIAPDAAMRVLEPAEITRLLEAAARSPELGPVVAFALDTGIRRGEALALRWENVDFAAATVTIAENVRFQPGQGLVYGPTKTRKSTRTIALSAEAVGRLRAHRANQNAWRLYLGPAWANDRNLIFTNKAGEPLSLGSFNRDFTRLVATAGIEGRLRFHDLRHTHGTLLAQLANPKVVSDRLGHSDVKFTLNRYVNPTHDHQRQAAEALSTLLRQAQ